MKNMGITVFPVFWGLMAGLTEFFGGLLLIFGLFTRPACMLLAFVMLLAGGNGIAGASHAKVSEVLSDRRKPENYNGYCFEII